MVVVVADAALEGMLFLLCFVTRRQTRCGFNGSRSRAESIVATKQLRRQQGRGWKISSGDC
jgi:hypothetical protein